MIRINLLPPEKRKKAQKKPKPPQQLGSWKSLIIDEKIPIITGIVLLILTLLTWGYLFYSMNNKIESLNNDIKTNITTIEALDKKLKQIKNLDSMIADLNQREKLINKLRSDQSQPIKVLDELNNKIPETIWFEAMSIIGNKIDLDGSALSYADLVGFINSLKQSKIFINVDLKNAKQKISGKETVYGFKITMDIITD